ncbi:MAG: hypothetical protein ABEJ28_00425 [Salinigranum sp.]
MNEYAFGRRIFVAVGIAVILLAGMVGFVIGSNGAQVRPSIVVFGVLTLPVTPGTMAAYASVLAAVIVTALLGAVSVASRYDEHA